MSDHPDQPSSTPPALPVPAAQLGAELARAVATRAATTVGDVQRFARAMSLDEARAREELAYLSVMTTEFCVAAAVVDDGAQARVLDGFARALLSAPPAGLTAEGLQARACEYRDALAHPHPDYGRAWTVGRAFARRCGSSHELAVIEFGAQAYMAQLPPMLGLLKSVSPV